MLVRTSYVINVYDYTDEVNVVDFECRNLSEVKQITRDCRRTLRSGLLFFLCSEAFISRFSHDET